MAWMVKTHLDALPGRLRVGKSDTHNSIHLLIVQHNIRDLANLRTFFPDVFFDIQDCRGILLRTASVHIKYPNGKKVETKTHL